MHSSTTKESYGELVIFEVLLALWRVRLGQKWVRSSWTDLTSLHFMDSS
jgi:hypothetical protein